jgi:hypothetical protein
MPSITEILAIIASIVAVIIAMRKAPYEMRATDAGAAKAYAETSALAAEQNTKLLERVTALLERVTTLECEVARLKKGQNDLGRLLADWMVGINKLIAQIRSRGEQPVWQPNIPDALRMIVMEEGQRQAGSHLTEFGASNE